MYLGREKPSALVGPPLRRQPFTLVLSVGSPYREGHTKWILRFEGPIRRPLGNTLGEHGVSVDPATPSHLLNKQLFHRAARGSLGDAEEEGQQPRVSTLSAAKMPRHGFCSVASTGWTPDGKPLSAQKSHDQKRVRRTLERDKPKKVPSVMSQLGDADYCLPFRSDISSGVIKAAALPTYLMSHLLGLGAGAMRPRQAAV